MSEIWKPVAGYEGLYEVSNKGNVKSLERTFFIDKGDGHYRTTPEKELIPSLHHSGYKVVGLTRDGTLSTKLVHRLVLKAFVENDDPVNKTITNHIDEVKSNNHADNLEWCDHQYNNTYGNRIAKAVKKTSKEVFGKCLATGEVLRYKSTADSEKDGFRQQSVARAARGDRKTYNGYKWWYANEIDGVRMEQGRGVRFR